MEPTTIRLDDKTQAIVDRKAKELSAVMGGDANTSAAIRSIILEWDWIQSMGQKLQKAQTGK